MGKGRAATLDPRYNMGREGAQSPTYGLRTFQRLEKESPVKRYSVPDGKGRRRRRLCGVWVPAFLHTKFSLTSVSRTVELH